MPENWSVTKNGKIIYGEGANNTFSYDDIAWSLSKEQRFGNHLEVSWSVGHHVLCCLKLARLLKYTKEEQLILFHHDDTEAYLKDLPKPLKNLLPDYQKLERDLAYQLSLFHGVDLVNLSPSIKYVDQYMLNIEYVTFAHQSSFTTWKPEVAYIPELTKLVTYMRFIQSYTSEDIYVKLLNTYEELHK